MNIIKDAMSPVMAPVNSCFGCALYTAVMNLTGIAMNSVSSSFGIAARGSHTHQKHARHMRSAGPQQIVVMSLFVCLFVCLLVYECICVCVTM
jgi:hypothetical protein